MSGLAVDSIFAGFRVDRVVGTGGMGVVHRATDVARDRVVALKVVAPEFASDPRFRSRFERETRLAIAIDHPNVVSVYEAGEHAGHLYLAMQYVEGSDLEALIATEGRLHPRHAAEVLDQVASALDAAHRLGLVHRDVKPGNILLEPGTGAPRAYLTDFGLAKMTTSTSGLTKTGRWVGTIDYAAPEQIEARATDARTDVYSLGCLAYQVLTGTVPFPRSREVAKIVAHLSEEPPSVGDAVAGTAERAAIDAVMWRALAKDPEQRFPSAGALASALADAVKEMPPPERELQISTGDSGAARIDRSARTTG